jgi:hypothetical protein
VNTGLVAVAASGPGVAARRRAIYAAVIGFFVLGVATYWRPDSGFTSLIRFGRQFEAARLPELAGLTIATNPGSGYDGQFYAQLAVNPDVTAPAVQHALDNPQYRARRILLPLVAHALGFGQPGFTLQVYALLNVAAWGLLAWWLYRATCEGGVPGAAIWAVCLLNLGVLDSVRESLTDLPALLLLAGAVGFADSNRKRLWSVAAMIAAAGLVRETTLLGVTLFWPGRACDAVGPDRARPFGRFVATGLAVLPTAAWMAWLAHTAPGGNTAGAANFGWPGVAFVHHFFECAAALRASPFHWQFVFGPIAALGLAWQSVSVIRRALDGGSAWARAALPYAVLFWLLGDAEWGGRLGGGYWAVARVCLPLTVAYCLLLPRDRWFWWRLVLPNLCVLHALMRFWPDFAF